MILGLVIGFVLGILTMVGLYYLTEWVLNAGHKDNSPRYTLAKYSTVDELAEAKAQILLNSIIHGNLKQSYVTRTAPDDQILFALSKLTKDNLEFVTIVNEFNAARKQYEDTLQWKEERGKDMYP